MGVTAERLGALRLHTLTESPSELPHAWTTVQLVDVVTRAALGVFLWGMAGLNDGGRLPYLRHLQGT